jgi:hypothetical protein
MYVKRIKLITRILDKKKLRSQIDSNGKWKFHFYDIKRRQWRSRDWNNTITKQLAHVSTLRLKYHSHDTVYSAHVNVYCIKIRNWWLEPAFHFKVLIFLCHTSTTKFPLKYFIPIKHHTCEVQKNAFVKIFIKTTSWRKYLRKITYCFFFQTLNNWDHYIIEVSRCAFYYSILKTTATLMCRLDLLIALMRH